MLNFLETQDPCAREPRPEEGGSAWSGPQVVQEWGPGWQNVKGLSHWDGAKS